MASDDRWGFEDDEPIAPGLLAKGLLGGGHRYEAYLAFSEELYALVVVKVLRPGRARDDGALAGLAAEAAMLARLSHPVLLRSFGAELSGDRPHLVLEYLEGPRLSTLIRRYGPLALEQLAPLAIQVCSALHYLAGQDVVHLDVKPSNIIMGAPPRLIDLSVARSVEEARAITAVIGTDAYMAPEQCLAGSGPEIGPAADVWGIGATLYEAACGYRPFPAPGKDEDRYPQLRFDPLPMREGLPAPLVDIVMACLQRDPQLRPTPAEVAEGLESLIAALPTRPRLGRLKPRLR